MATSLSSEPPSAPAAISLLRMQRRAKRVTVGILGDITNRSSDNRTRAQSVDSKDIEGDQSTSANQSIPTPVECVESEDGSPVSPRPCQPTSQQQAESNTGPQEAESRSPLPPPRSPRYLPQPPPNPPYQRHSAFHPSAMYYAPMPNHHHMPTPAGPTSGTYHHAPSYLPGGPPLPPWY